MLNPIINYNEEVAVILDANAYVHTSFHAYEPRLDVKGKDHRVLHGLLDTLVGLTYFLDRIDYLYLVFDPIDGSLYRKTLFPSYKSHRPPKDPDLLRQSEDAQHILRNGFGLPIITHSGYEADDIIGSLAKKISKETQTVIVSPDKDLAQLVNENTFLLKKKKAREDKSYVLFDAKKVKEDYGVSPELIPDWLTLVGDIADGLPGLNKVGPKTAVKILSQYPTVEHMISIVNHIEDKKLAEKINEVKDLLPLIKKLATIVCDLPIEESIVREHDNMGKVRNSSDYSSKVNKLIRYFNMSNHYSELFI